MAIHEELEAELAAFKGTPRRPDVPVGLHRQHRASSRRHRRGGPDRLGRPQPRLDHRRDAPVEGAPQDLPARRRRRPCATILRRGRASSGRRTAGLPYRLILVVTDGVFSMDGDIAPLPGIVEAAEAFGAAVMVDDAHASGVLGRNGRGTRRPLRAPRPGRDPGRHAVEGGRRRSAATSPASQALRDILDPARPAVPLLDVAPAGGRGRLPRGDPRAGGGARAHGAALGEHAPVQGRARPARLRHRRVARRRSRR